MKVDTKSGQPVKFHEWDRIIKAYLEMSLECVHRCLCVVNEMDLVRKGI